MEQMVGEQEIPDHDWTSCRPMKLAYNRSGTEQRQGSVDLHPSPGQLQAS